MGDINIKQLESLRWRMRVIERLTVIGTAWIALAVYQKKEELVYYLVGAVVLLFLLKYYTQFRLRKRQFVSNLVEQRTMELRFQRDAMQAESEKLSRALSALADAQDELVRKERLASIGQLTKGLVDRILNPLNYINNFAHLSAALAKDIKQNIDEDEETGKHDNYNDTQELLVLLTGNLDKIAKHGDNTVRIVKAMEELLKVLEMQEEILQFSHFTNEDSWALGCQIVAEAARLGAGVAVSIRLNNGYTVFQHGMDGTNLINAQRLERKQQTVKLTEESSLQMYVRLKQREKELEELIPDSSGCLAVGGAFPIRVEEVGVIGSVAVSGLGHVADHDLLVKCISRYLHVDEVPRIRAV